MKEQILSQDTDEQFFAQLTAFDHFARVTESEFYAPLPDGWHVVITDIRGSTKAIEAGRYKDVNAVGVASIISALNAVGDLEVPYVFGGDGATLLIPDRVLPSVSAALAGAAHRSRHLFGLELRVGVVPMSEIREAGHDVLVSKYRASEHIALAMLSGVGIDYAEDRIKDPQLASKYNLEIDDYDIDVANFEGFECRWKPITNRHGVVVSLLVKAIEPDEAEQQSTYRDVLEFLDSLGDSHRPVDLSTLSLATDSNAFRAEAALRTGRTKGIAHAVYLKKVRAMTALATRLLESGRSLGGFHGDRYGTEVVDNTDFRKFDGVLRMILDLSCANADRLETYLAEQHAAHRLIFGVHRSSASLMTCFVSNYEGEHVHFVDGAEGGYAVAAKQFKQQAKALSED